MSEATAVHAPPGKAEKAAAHGRRKAASNRENHELLAGFRLRRPGIAKTGAGSAFAGVTLDRATMMAGQGALCGAKELPGY